MNIIEIIAIGIGLAMDAFAASICKGLSVKKAKKKHAAILALYFGLFHFGMPLLGFLLGEACSHFVSHVDHWIAFVLLGVIGAKMIVDSFSKKKKQSDDASFKSLITLVIATSIDAFAIGVSFAFLEANIFLAASIVGVITFALSLIGFQIGNKFGNKLGNKSEIAGGINLILIGLKILLEHLGVIVF